MKNLKIGFTMAELLLCLAIVGIISAMGVVATKHSADSAYNLFYYNGYINLYNTIAEIRSNGDDVTIAKLANYLGDKNDNTITAKNGIEYTLSSADGNTIITMTVPQRKTRTNNGKSTVQFAISEIDDGFLIPLDNDICDVNLQTRRDLLPAYIDDGIVGRMKKDGPNNYSMEKIAYYSYQQAFCAIKPTGVAGIISCSSVAGIPDKEGVLKIADPRKAR